MTLVFQDSASLEALLAQTRLVLFRIKMFCGSFLLFDLSAHFRGNAPLCQMNNVKFDFSDFSAIMSNSKSTNVKNIFLKVLMSNVQI